MRSTPRLPLRVLCALPGMERPCLHDPYLNEEHRQNGLYAGNRYAASAGGYHRVFRNIDLLPDDLHINDSERETVQ